MQPENETKAMESSKHATSNSYLVRVWHESGDGADLRFYVRDLKTGEERYMGDPNKISELLTRGLRAHDAPQARNEKTA